MLSLQGPLDDPYATSIRNCDATGPLMVYVSKMIPSPDKVPPLSTVRAVLDMATWRVDVRAWVDNEAHSSSLRGPTCRKVTASRQLAGERTRLCRMVMLSVRDAGPLLCLRARVLGHHRGGHEGPDPGPQLHPGPKERPVHQGAPSDLRWIADCLAARSVLCIAGVVFVIVRTRTAHCWRFISCIAIDMFNTGWPRGVLGQGSV